MAHKTPAMANFFVFEFVIISPLSKNFSRSMLMASSHAGTRLPSHLHRSRALPLNLSHKLIFLPSIKKTGVPDADPPVTNFSYGGIIHIRYKGRRSSFLSACIQAPLYLIYINHIPTIYKLQIFSPNKKTSHVRGPVLYKVDCYFIVF